MAADGVKESLTVYEMATEHLRKAREVLDRLESASSMASDANDTTEVVSNNIARSLFLCNYIKCGPEPERAQWNGNVERMEHEAGMLQERLDTYMVGQRQIEQGVYLLVGAMNSTGKQKEQVMKKQSDTSVAVQSLSKSSEKKCLSRLSLSLILPSLFAGKSIAGTRNLPPPAPWVLDAVGDFSSSFPMGDLEYASLPGESYYTSDGSTESVTFPRVGDGVLGKRKIVVRCNHPTSLPKIDHALQLEQPTDPVTSSSGSFDPAIRRSCSFEVGTFEEALAEFRRSQLAQGLEEEVRNEYLAICKHTMCLPHESKTARYNYAMEGIPLMVKVLCQMRTIGIGKEGLTSVKNSLQLLEDYGFECEYLRFVFEKISSVQESFKECEKEEDELRARKVALDQRLRMLQGTL